MVILTILFLKLPMETDENVKTISKTEAERNIEQIVYQTNATFINNTIDRIKNK
jgi:hypothetical protein